MPGYLRFIFTRAIVLYLACFFLIWRILDYNQLIDNAVNQTMSRLTPPMDYFAEFVDKGDHYNRFKLMNCINYHQAVAHFFPYQKAEAYGMLGFCYERLGQQSQAVTSYQQAISLNPDYFWPYYNLGVIFYQKEKFSQAVDYLSQGLEQIPIKTVFLLSRSKVYNDVNLSKKEGPSDYLQSLKQGRREAYILMMDSLYKTGSYDRLWKAATEGLKEDLDTQGVFYYYAAVACFHQKSYKQAIELLQIALQIDPQNADALMYMGMCFKIANKIDTAQLFINKATQLQQQGNSVIEEHLNCSVRFF